jgi:hypothetical protein
VPAAQELEARLVMLWSEQLPQPSLFDKAPFGVRFSAKPNPSLPRKDPGLLRTMQATYFVVLPVFSPDKKTRGAGAILLYALYRIYWSARLNYRISKKKRRHDGDTKHVIVKQLKFDAQGVPAEFAWAAELAEQLWSLLPALARLHRALTSPERILIWWAQFASASFVVWLHTPGPKLQPGVAALAREVARRRIRSLNRRVDAEDYASRFVEDMFVRLAGEKFVGRYEPPPVDSVPEAAGKAVAYLLTSMRRYFGNAALAAGGQTSVSTRKRWRAQGLDPKTPAELDEVEAEMRRRRLHEVPGYRSQVEVARQLKRARSTVQSAIKKAVAAGAVVLGPDERIAAADVEKLKQFLPKRGRPVSRFPSRS